MSSDELYYLNIEETSDLISKRQISPVELVTCHLERISDTDERLNSFVTLLAEQSLIIASEAEQAIISGNYIGPMHGIPVGLKDLYFTKDIRTTMGSTIYEDFIPSYDATVTKRLKNAGAIILGKLQMHEFALGATSENPHYGPARNPWNIECMTGGSSGGSASAVASGQCMAALGTDTGGSIRIPAALCGIVGFKPTFGRVDRHGVYPLCWSLDTVGPMTRTVCDAAIMFDSIVNSGNTNKIGRDYTRELKSSIKGLRIGIPKEYFFDVVDDEVKEGVLDVADVLKGLGALIVDISIPALDHSFAISTAIMMAESASLHIENLRNNAEDIGDDVRSRLELGTLMPALDYIKSQRSRTSFNRQLDRAFSDVDVILAPSTPIGAPFFSQSTVLINGKEESTLFLLPRLTRPFNISGSPTISVPCGFTSSGMPIGVQLAGRIFDEPTVLNVAYLYEQATQWHTMRPKL